MAVALEQGLDPGHFTAIRERVAQRALTDFVKLRMWVFEVVRGSQEEFLAGYGTNPLTTREATVRYRVALGLELLSGLVYFATARQPEIVADYDRRLAAWLAAN